jgi:FtsH-binding integral membrane protein
MNYEPDRRSYQAEQDYYGRYGATSFGTVDQAAPAVRGAFLNKVYMTLTGGVAIAMASAYFCAVQATQGGAMQGFMRAMTSGMGFVLVFLAYIALSFAVRAAAKVPGVNLLVYGLFTAVTGVIISPLFFVALVTTGPVAIWQAFGITAIAFGGLTGYVLISGKDFTFMRGFLVTGLFVLLAFMIAGFFFNSWGFHMGVTCVGLLLFMGFVLYDTSVIMRVLTPQEWVAGALSLFVDFINMFIRVLSIILNSRR